MLILITLSTNSCKSTTKDIQPIKKIETVAVPIEKTPLDLPLPDPIELDKVNWIIITKDNADKVFTDLANNQTDLVLFGLTDNNYETLSKNLAHIRAHIIKQKELIKQYKEYYE